MIWALAIEAIDSAPIVQVNTFNHSRLQLMSQLLKNIIP